MKKRSRNRERSKDGPRNYLRRRDTFFAFFFATFFFLAMMMWRLNLFFWPTLDPE